VATERELYEDWKPLLEGQQDSLVDVDLDMERDELLIEQTNYSRGVDVEGHWPVYRKQPLRLFDPYC